MSAEEAVWVEGGRHAEFDVTGLGENSLDLMFSVEQFPVAGGKVDLIDLGSQPGGQVATTVLGCAKLGLRTAYLGVVGEGPAAEAALAPLRGAGVHLGEVIHRPGVPTRTATILVRPSDGERSVLVRRDPALDARPGEFSVETLSRSRLLHLDATDPELTLWAMRHAERAGVPVMLDLDQVVPGVEKILERAQFPVVSGPFARAFGGEDRVEAGLERMAASKACRLAVATCADDGAVALWQGAHIQVDAFPVEVADSTGAGDAFRAGLIWGLLRGQSVEPMLRSAHAVGALSCQAVGAQTGLPDEIALEAFLASHGSGPETD